MSTQQYIKPDPVNIPLNLRQCPQWVNWDPALVDERWTKVLKNAHTRNRASSTNPDTWATFERALKTNPIRIGFVLTNSGFTVIDLDHCHDPDTGIIAEWAWVIIGRLNSYTEISVSGTGVHIIIRGQLPPGRRRVGQIETYDSGRYITMTGAVLDGYDTIADDDGRLTTWHGETFPQEPEPSSEPFTRVGLSLATEEIIDRAARAANGATFREYYDGGLGNKPSMSEARYALIGACLFWTQDPGQLAEIIRSSGQWTKKLKGRPELLRKEIQDQLHRYHGPIYGEHRPPPKPPPPPVFEPGATCDQRLKLALETIELQAAEIAAAKETIAIREGVIARERELRIAAEERANRLAEANSKTIQILRTPGLAVGPRVTTFALAIDLGARIANGETPTEHGYRVPAARLAEMTGQSEDTVARHLREVDRRGIIPKHVVRRPARENIDPGSGEITIAGATDQNFISVPEGNIVNLIDRIIGYQRPELETGHGGIRTPACKDHPDAGTIRRWTLECAECHQPLDGGISHQRPDARQDNPPPVTRDVWGGNLHSDTTVTAPSHSGVKLPPHKATPFRRSSDGIMPPDEAAPPAEADGPAEAWATYPLEPPTNTHGHDRWTA